ncbi:hypothetical protein HOLleu_44868 [Holothuria leucospilota]|uniref:Uncharacterized protein n=1 Tax=Holothuria leucospilota TaxID=206669 RepID=A0A9Q0YCU1_HOLLE|nr:hypothetical protein HOLleu_44868 [Holothuria leucospilota]
MFLMYISFRFEMPDPVLIGTSTPIRHQAHEMVSVSSDIQSDEEGVEPLWSQAESHDVPSTSGGGSASPIATVAMEFEKPQADEGEETPSTSGQDNVRDQSLDISVEYTQKGDFIFPIESESEDSDSSWDESNWEDERSWSDVSEELDENHPQGKLPLTVDEVFDVEELEPDVASEDESSAGPDKNVDDIVTDKTCIAYSSNILNGLKDIPVPTCSSPLCDSRPEIKWKMVGTAMMVKWVCEKGHTTKRWDSQPKLRRNYAGDIGLSASILFSGNNYNKIKMLLKCLNMGICHANLHHYVQRTYTCPVVEDYWNGMQSQILAARRDHEVVISGDGRNDSPGFSAQYCTYTTMDYNTGDILNVAIVDKREVQLKSPNMEKVAFLKCMEILQDNNVKVTEVITDAHPSIRAHLKQQPDIYHSSDVWHGAKNIGKKLAEVSKKASNRALIKWTGDVVNHFWYCCSKSDGDRWKLLSRWKGILHHVVGRHEWVFGDGGGPAKCEHGPLPETWQAKVIPEGSPAHVALREVVLDRRLINSLDYYTRFRHTGMLENFQSHILAYASKRFAYSYPAYKARNLLAAIDFQKHKERTQKVNDGKPVFRRHYFKGSDRWGVVPVKEAKGYSYISELMTGVYRKRLEDPSTQSAPSVLAEDDPRRLAPTIRSTQPPPTAELAGRHQSRF